MWLANFFSPVDSCEKQLARAEAPEEGRASPPWSKHVACQLFFTGRQV